MAAILTSTPGFGTFGTPAWARPSVRRLPASVYRRRRIAVAALSLGVLLAGSWALSALGGGPLTASGAESSPRVVATRSIDVEPVSLTTRLVGPGDTLWSIARELQPTGDVRPLVDALAAARGGRPLQVGERITLPPVQSLDR
jgi:hypothetical protein